MQVNISGHQLDVTDALRDYVGEKLSRLERHFDKITNVQVIMERFNGGGHLNSAGAQTDMEPEEVIAELKKIVPEYLGTDGEESDTYGQE